MVGDWGFKRELPLKTTTKTTLPLVRVKQVDSMEHITDFQSASDHTITLEKVQEMNVYFTVPPYQDASLPGMSYPPWKSVFEPEGDITHVKAEEAEKTEKVRWKFKGRWLAGMTDGEFDEYLTEVARRRPGFHAYLKKQLAAEMSEDQDKAAKEESGHGAEVAPTSAVRTKGITQQQFTDYLRSLRNDPPTLYRLVGRFLDLAPIELMEQLKKLGNFNLGKSYNIDRDSPYAAGGPPITHPSAGLSYLRTSSYLDNHPLYGPQKHHPPVQARVLTPRHNSAGFRPILGVGGLISTGPAKEFSDRSSTEPWGLHTFDPSVSGGTKLYVYPDAASVDSTGNVRLRLKPNPDAMATMVHKEMVGEGDVFDDEARQSKSPSPGYFRYRGASKSSMHIRSPRLSSTQNYGLSQKTM
jgi:hypothetical protein